LVGSKGVALNFQRYLAEINGRGQIWAAGLLRVLPFDILSSFGIRHSSFSSSFSFLPPAENLPFIRAVVFREPTNN
jgi:hypothetical protein